tara:strand:+ start:286 stop:486 length:201 start_codon:yes stop_codon:yes gene_type:complete
MIGENSAPEETNEEMVERLKRFYSVDTIEEILIAQSKHVEKLQGRGSPIGFAGECQGGKPNRQREG